MHKEGLVGYRRPNMALGRHVWRGICTAARIYKVGMILEATGRIVEKKGLW